jgi:4-phospho-D-threonate 3-dehydrogenase / 4-phospho-D-erythronate 3-dehydrogenase
VSEHLLNHQEKSSAQFALSMGDPAGIGPEIALKAMFNTRFAERTIIIGDLSVLVKVAEKYAMHVSFHQVMVPSEFVAGKINVYDCRRVTPEQFTPGKVSAICGAAAFCYIEKAIAFAMQGEVAGVITNPINKESLKVAGINYPGHTEIFAEKTGVSRFSMLFLLRGVGVAHVTTHVSLREAIDLVTAERVGSHIRLLNNALRQLGVSSPRIAVGGLNPHAGENGLFGDEEIRYIGPAIATAQEKGIMVSGPFPPDTVFMRAFNGEFDGIVAMLHDHGFVALKTMDFNHGVNITIGLPIIRTSVGHGTAFPIVGKGTASEESLLAAFDAAVKLHENRGKV